MTGKQVIIRCKADRELIQAIRKEAKRLGLTLNEFAVEKVLKPFLQRHEGGGQ